MKKNQQYSANLTQHYSKTGMIGGDVGAKEDTRVPEFQRIVDRLTQSTSLQRDYIYAIKKKLDALSFIGDANEAGEERPVPVTIHDLLNEQLDQQDRNTKQLEIMLNFLNTLV